MFYSLRRTVDPFILIYADVDSSGTRMFYSFYEGDILKTKESNKGVKYSLYCGKHPFTNDPQVFQRLSLLDQEVLRKGDSILHVLQLKRKDFSECAGFELEVFQLHGWPKGKKFGPL